MGLPRKINTNWKNLWSASQQYRRYLKEFYMFREKKMNMSKMPQERQNCIQTINKHWGVGLYQNHKATKGFSIIVLSSNGLKSPIKSHRLIDETESKILHIYDAKQSLRSIRKFKIFPFGHNKSQQSKLLKINEPMELKWYTIKWPIGPRKKSN